MKGKEKQKRKRRSLLRELLRKNLKNLTPNPKREPTSNIKPSA